MTNKELREEVAKRLWKIDNRMIIGGEWEELQDQPDHKNHPGSVSKEYYRRQADAILSFLDRERMAEIRAILEPLKKESHCNHLTAAMLPDGRLNQLLTLATLPDTTREFELCDVKAREQKDIR